MTHRKAVIRELIRHEVCGPPLVRFPTESTGFGNDRRAAEEPIKHTRTIIGLADVPRRFPFRPLRRQSPASVPQGCRRPL